MLHLKVLRGLFKERDRGQAGKCRLTLDNSQHWSWAGTQYFITFLLWLLPQKSFCPQSSSHCCQPFHQIQQKGDWASGLKSETCWMCIDFSCPRDCPVTHIWKSKPFTSETVLYWSHSHLTEAQNYFNMEYSPEKHSAQEHFNKTLKKTKCKL